MLLVFYKNKRILLKKEKKISTKINLKSDIEGTTIGHHKVILFNFFVLYMLSQQYSVIYSYISFYSLLIISNTKTA